MGDFQLKILLLGDSFVGKTSLILKYIDGYFSENHISTIGIDFKEKKINYKNMEIILQIWDTSGQERFRSLAKSFYNKADGILFVFDVSNKESFENLKYWLNDTNIEKDAKKIIVGNKIDLQEQRVISKEKMEKLGEANNNIKSFETSARTGENVTQIFEELAELILANKSEEEINKLCPKKKQKLDNKKENKKKNCC